MIELANISKAFAQQGTQVKALDAINLHIKKGEIFGLIGHSGAGKSTLVRMINALETPSSGEVRIDGQPLTQAAPAAVRRQKREIGMIFQHFNLLENRTVAQNVALPLVLNRVANADRQRIVTDLLAFVGLQDKHGAYPRELSGGQKQRVGIARALVNNPKILLCDEATSALDPQTTRAILDLLKRINREQQVTIVIVTHEMSVVTHACDSLAVMSQGRIIEQGPTLALFQHPEQQITREFVNSVINYRLPRSVFRSLPATSTAHLYRLEFANIAASDSIVTDIVRQGRVELSIIFANMIDIRDDVVGYMFVVIKGTDDNIQATLEALTGRGLTVTSIDPREFCDD